MGQPGGKRGGSECMEGFGAGSGGTALTDPGRAAGGSPGLIAAAAVETVWEMTSETSVLRQLPASATHICKTPMLCAWCEDQE